MRFADLHSEPPFSVRPVAMGEVVLVASGAGPLADDELELDVVVGDDSELTVRTTGATLALASAAGRTSRTTTTATIGQRGQLDWLPEPFIATARARHHGVVDLRVAADARVVWREELLLGRHDEEPGDCVLELRIDVGGVPTLRHRLAVGPATPGWRSAAGVGAARCVGLAAIVDPDLTRSGAVVFDDGRAAVLPLDVVGAAIVTAVADDAITLRDRLEVGIAAINTRG